MKADASCLKTTVFCRASSDKCLKGRFLVLCLRLCVMMPVGIQPVPQFHRSAASHENGCVVKARVFLHAVAPSE